MISNTSIEEDAKISEIDANKERGEKEKYEIS